MTHDSDTTAPELTHRPLPFVSIMLPVRNEARYIEACVDRLLEQKYPADKMEVLVVDGVSDDETHAILLDLQRRVGERRLRVFVNPDQTVPPALNIAIRAARGTIIIRFDGHSIPPRDYVKNVVRVMQASGAANVGGAVVPVGDTAFGEAVAIATQHRLGAGDALYRLGGRAGEVDTVQPGAFRRDVFGLVGLFDESMVRNQDYEMNVRIRNAGERIYFDPSIHFTYTPRGSARTLWRQYFQYGWWRVQTLRRYPGSLRWRQIIPAAFVATLISLTVLAPWWSVALITLGVLVVIYLSAIGATSLVATRGSTASPLLTAIAFATIHVGWGLGFLINVFSLGTFPYRAAPPAVPRLEGTHAE